MGLIRTSRSLAIFLALGASLPLLWIVRSQNELQVGYAVIEAGESSLPVATALFSFRNNDGILVSEAGVGAVVPIGRGRLFVDARFPTGVALANPSAETVTATLTLRDQDGELVAEELLEIGAGRHLAQFVAAPGQLFEDIQLADDFTGSLTFDTGEDPGLAPLTIRQARNAYGEALLATLPVADLEDQPAPSGALAEEVVFPHLGAGDILTSQIILLNPTAEVLEGEIILTASSGLPLEIELNGQKGNRFPYRLEPDGVFQGTLTAGDSVLSGYARATVTQGNRAPAGTVIFQFRDAAGRLQSEAGVGAGRPTRQARVFVDTVGTQTGVALANPGNDAQTVTFRLQGLNGVILAETEREIPGAGHLAIFAGELFEDIPQDFRGVLTIESSHPVVPVTLKLTVNAGGGISFSRRCQWPISLLRLTGH